MPDLEPGTHSYQLLYCWRISTNYGQQLRCAPNSVKLQIEIADESEASNPMQVSKPELGKPSDFAPLYWQEVALVPEVYCSSAYIDSVLADNLL